MCAVVVIKTSVSTVAPTQEGEPQQQREKSFKGTVTDLCGWPTTRAIIITSTALLPCVEEKGEADFGILRIADK